MANGGLFDLIKRDAKQFVTSGGYQVDIKLTTPDNSKTINITGWAAKIAWSFDSDGNQVNTSNAHITIDENLLIEASYPYRNAKKEVAMLQHQVSYTDSAGQLRDYRVRENLPNDNLGLLYLVLGDHKKTV
jgi:hypothetical protein